MKTKSSNLFRLIGPLVLLAILVVISSSGCEPGETEDSGILPTTAMLVNVNGSIVASTEHGEASTINLSVSADDEVTLLAGGVDEAGIVRVAAIASEPVLSVGDASALPTTIAESINTASETRTTRLLAVYLNFSLLRQNEVESVTIEVEAEDIFGNIGPRPSSRSKLVISLIEETDDPEPEPQSNPVLSRTNKPAYFSGEDFFVVGRNLSFPGVSSSLILEQGSTRLEITDDEPENRRLNATISTTLSPGDFTVRAKVGTLLSNPLTTHVKGRQNGAFRRISYNLNSPRPVEIEPFRIESSRLPSNPSVWNLSIKNKETNIIANFRIADPEGFNLLASPDNSLVLYSTIDPTPPRDNNRRLVILYDFENGIKITRQQYSSCSQGCLGPENAMVRGFNEVSFTYNGREQRISIEN